MINLDKNDDEFEEKKVKLNLEFNECVYRIMKQRKNSYAKKNKLEELTWEEYLKIRVFANKKL